MPKLESKKIETIVTRKNQAVRLVSAVTAVLAILGAAPGLADVDGTEALEAEVAVEAATAPRGRDFEFMRGVVVSCPGYGRIWGSPRMEDSLRVMKRAGVEWIAIHPYASVRRDGTVTFRLTSGADYLDRAVDYVRAEGQKLFWKPHLAYWGSFEWRGAIEFGDDEAAWKRFFEGYRDFILDQASFAQSAGAELFAIGVELDATASHAEDWNNLFDEVRRRYFGRITYTANWDTVRTVPFWDRVDMIGVQGYFPLAQGDDPDRETIWSGWDAPLKELAALSAAHGDRPILFGEIGYNRSPDAAREPWSPVTLDSAESRALRRRLMEVAIARLEGEPFVAGLFWWKWIPGVAPHDLDFSMKDPEALEVLRSHWGERGLAAGGLQR